MSTQSLPIIDFSAFLTGNEKAQQQVATQILAASKEWGFFYLSNFGLTAQEVEQAFAVSAKFFALPEQEKLKVAWQSAQSNQGYIAVKRETLDPTTAPDLKEAYNIATASLDSNDDSDYFPQAYPEFKTQMTDFIKKCTWVADSVLRAFAISLKQDPNFFVEAHNLRQHTFRLLHYPALPKGFTPEDSQNRAGAHTDYGSITLLFQDNVGGLEVKSRNGGWVKATPVPGTIVINTGDLMQQWTNDVFLSNPHRVRQPKDSMHKDRYSIAYFCSPNNEKVISCIDTCQSDSQPAKYPPVTTSEYMISRLNRTY